MRAVVPASLVLIILASALLAGCASPNVTINGASAPSLRTTDGIVTETQNGTLLLGLGSPVQTEGVLQACVGGCNASDSPNGTIIAEGSLVSFSNLRLNALGPEGDSAVYFYNDGQPSSTYLRWRELRSSFQLSTDTEVNGFLTTTRGAGTLTAFPGLGPNGTTVEVKTVGLEGAEQAIFLRGTGRLVNGTANVVFPEAWTVLTSPQGVVTAQVTLTSKGAPVFVSEKDRTHIKVETVDGSASGATFDFFVQTLRLGGERFESVREG